MPPIVHLILLVFSFCCFAFASWRNAAPDWNRVVGAGLAFLVASMLSW